MGDIYVIGDQVVALTYYEYLEAIKKKKQKPSTRN